MSRPPQGVAPSGARESDRLSAAEIRRRVAGRESSCEEITRAHLDRIASLEPRVDAFLSLLPERAIDRARAMDRALASGQPAPPLAGVPVAIKDVLHIAGLPTTCGSRILDGLRIGVPRAFLSRGVESETMARFDEAVSALAAAGARVLDVDLPHVPHAVAAYYLVATAEASSNLARYDGVRFGLREPGASDLASSYGRTRDAGFGAEVKRRIILGTFALSSGYYDAYYLRAQKVRTLIRRDFEHAFESCDAIATPTTPTAAFRIGEKTDDPLQMYLGDIFTVPANLAGIPALSLPCGLASGLPVGLQLLGRPFDEVTLLGIGAVFQRITRHHELRPGR